MRMRVAKTYSVSRGPQAFVLLVTLLGVNLIGSEGYGFPNVPGAPLTILPEMFRVVSDLARIEGASGTSLVCLAPLDDVEPVDKGEFSHLDALFILPDEGGLVIGSSSTPPLVHGQVDPALVGGNPTDNCLNVTATSLEFMLARFWAVDHIVEFSYAPCPIGNDLVTMVMRGVTLVNPIDRCSKPLGECVFGCVGSTDTVTWVGTCVNPTENNTETVDPALVFSGVPDMAVSLLPPDSECPSVSCANTSVAEGGAVGWIVEPSLLHVTCGLCPPGNGVPEGSENGICVPCDRGSFGDGVNGCVTCPVGSIAPEEGMFTCVTCPDGSIAASSGYTEHDVCVMCPAGTVSNGTECVPCPAGSVNFVPGSHACFDCPAGMFAPHASSAGCLPCPSGWTVGEAGDTCDPCPEGFYSTDAASGCLPCPAGTISIGTGAQKCVHESPVPSASPSPFGTPVHSPTPSRSVKGIIVAVDVDSLSRESNTREIRGVTLVTVVIVGVVVGIALLVGLGLYIRWARR